MPGIFDPVLCACDGLIKAYLKLRNSKKLTHRIASEPSLWRNDAQRAVHQAGASLPFDKVAAGNFRAQGQKLSIVF